MTSINEEMERATRIEEVADQMAQELQEFIDAGEEGGSDMEASKGLLREYDAVKNGDATWMYSLRNKQPVELAVFAADPDPEKP